MRRRKAFLTAVTLANPLCTTLSVPLLAGFQTNEPAKPLPGLVFLAGLHLCLTAAVPYSASLESAGIQFNKAAAVAHTIPDGVSVFPLIGRRYYC